MSKHGLVLNKEDKTKKISKIVELLDNFSSKTAEIEVVSAKPRRESASKTGR